MPVSQVWDIPTRLFHWGLVGLFGAMWYSGKQGLLNVHILCGEAMAVLLFFRLIWGVFGSQTARFSDFVRGPTTILRYLKGEISEAEQPGHNPLGGLMVVVLLLMLLGQVSTGFFSADIDSFIDDGPLAHLIGDYAASVTAIHKWLFNGLLALVGLHIAAIIVYRVCKKQHLIRAMVTGNKMIFGKVRELYFVPLWQAAVWFGVALGIVMAIISLR